MSTINDRIKALSPESRQELTQLLQQKRLNHRQPRKQVDVVIMGGGLAGLTLARQLRRAHNELSILVIDKYAHPVPEAAFKVGESTVELGSYYFREVLGLKDLLESTQLFKAGLRYYFPAGDNSDIARRVELGGIVLPPIRSHQLDRGRFENSLWEENLKQQIECWDDCTVRDIELSETEQVITIERHEQEEIVAARWVIDAAGRSSLLKRKLDLSEAVDHNVSAVWFRINDKIDMGTWSDDSEWRGRVPEGLRWLGTNHLMDRGYWTWLIPLAGDVTSVGIVADGTLHPHQSMNRFEKALEWLKQHEPQCAIEVESRQHLLQDFKVLRHYAHGCRRVFSPQRWAITGEAGVFLDPFYSPGSDFISMSNSLITDLISCDLRGESIATRSEIYNHSYLNTFKSFLATYQGQYPLMGNAQGMTAKVVWDWAGYWGVSALLFFHGNKLFDLAWTAAMREHLQRFNALYVEMQGFFRQLAMQPAEQQTNQFINILDFPYLEELYFGLNTKHDDEGLKRQVVKNLTLLEKLATDCKTRRTIPYQTGTYQFGNAGVFA